MHTCAASFAAAGCGCVVAAASGIISFLSTASHSLLLNKDEREGGEQCGWKEGVLPFGVGVGEMGGG